MGGGWCPFYNSNISGPRVGRPTSALTVASAPWSIGECHDASFSSVTERRPWQAKPAAIPKFLTFQCGRSPGPCPSLANSNLEWNSEPWPLTRTSLASSVPSLSGGPHSWFTGPGPTWSLLSSSESRLGVETQARSSGFLVTYEIICDLLIIFICIWYHIRFHMHMISYLKCVLWYRIWYHTKKSRIHFIWNISINHIWYHRHMISYMISCTYDVICSQYDFICDFILWFHMHISYEKYQ